MSSSREEDDSFSPTLDLVIQKLEESLFDSEGHEADSGVVTAPVSNRIQRIITRNLAETSDGEAIRMEENLKESGPVTQTSHKEQVKQCSFTVKLEQMLPSPADSDSDSVSPWQLEVQEQGYRRRLLLFQEAQQKQAQLVQKLQTKVLQYKSRCGQLEGQVLEKTSDVEKMRLLLQAHQDSAQRQEQDLNANIRSKVAQLEEQRRRCGSLSQVNCVLREQLEQADALKRSLLESLQKARQDAHVCDNRLRLQQETSSSRLSREQARVRSLWRQAASLRNAFTQLRSSADRTLSNMRSECATACQQLLFACRHLEATQESAPDGAEVSLLERQLKDKLREAMQLQGRWDAEKVELNSRIMELNDAVKQLRSQNSEKDASLDRMETSRSEDKGDMAVLQSENQALQKVLQEVFKLVSSGGDSDAFEGHLSCSLRTNTILTAVQGALAKHKQQTEDFSARLEASLEEADTLRTQLQQSDSAKLELEARIREGTKQSQEAKDVLEETIREKDRCHRELDVISSEKRDVEQLLAGVQQERESQRAELESLRRRNQDVELQLARLRSEARRGERSLEDLEGKQSDLWRDLVAGREALNKLALEKDVLEEDKASLALALTKAECHGKAQEALVVKLRHQEAGLKDSLAKMVALGEGLAKDKVELNHLLLQTEAEKAELDERRLDAEADRVAAREEVTQLQREKATTLVEKEALENSHAQLLDLKHKAEDALYLLQKENAHNIEQYSQVKRQMQSTSEELHEVRKQLDMHVAGLAKATTDRDELAKEKAALEVQLCSAERKSYDLTQELLALRSEKHFLETGVFQSQELASSLEFECSRVEAERRSLLSANESLTRDAAQARLDAERQLAQVAHKCRDLEMKLVLAEKKALETLKTRDELHRELEGEREQKEQQLKELIEQQEQLRSLYKELTERSREEVERAKEDMLKAQQHCERSILQANSEKQQALTQNETEKASLLKRLSILQNDFKSVTSELELTQREALTKQEQDQNEISVTRCEMEKLRADLKASLNSYDVAEKSGWEKLREMSQQQQATQRQVELLKTQLQDSEERLAKAQIELTEVRQSLRESVHGWEKQRKETINLRQLLKDETSEKDAVRASNKELRTSVKLAESDNSSLKRAVEEREKQVSILEERSVATQQEASTLRKSMREIEKSRLQARRRNQELRRQLKVVQGEKQRQEQELKQLQAQLCQEEQQREEARLLAFSLKQKVVECEAARDAANNQASSLQRRVSELEESERQGSELQRVQQAQQYLVDQKHNDEVARLQRALEDAAFQSGRADTAALDLEGRLAASEGRRRKLERKISAVGSTLRRLRPVSPRRRLPLRGSAGDCLTDDSTSCADDEELELDSIQAGMQDLQRALRDTQRERDESKAQLVSLSEQVLALQDKSACEVTNLHKSLQAFKDGNREMEEQLRQSQTSFFLQQEATERDKMALETEVARLRSALLMSQNELKSIRDKMESSQVTAHSERERLKDVQMSMVRLENSRRSMGEELQCSQERTTELEAEVATLQEKLAEVGRKLGESDVALKVGKELWSTTLAQAEGRQNQLGEQIRALTASEEVLQENLKQLNRAMTDSEAERQLLQNRLDETRNALADSKKLNHSLREHSQNLQRDRNDLELRNSELEKHNKSLQQSVTLQQAAKRAALEKTERLDRVVFDLESQVSDLESKVTGLKAELQKLQEEKVDLEKTVARLTKDKGALKKSLEKADKEIERLRTEESVAKETQQTLICLERQLLEKHDQVTALQISTLKQQLDEETRWRQACIHKVL
nr:rootletin-like [Nerophis lumbriciformis]